MLEKEKKYIFLNFLIFLYLDMIPSFKIELFIYYLFKTSKIKD